MSVMTKVEARRESREDQVILATLAQAGEDVSRERLYLGSLAMSWGTNTAAIVAITKHQSRGHGPGITKDKVELLAELEQAQALVELSAAVVELSVTFPGLNLPSLQYLLVISQSQLLLTQCILPCTHPPTTPRVQESYLRDVEFGISLVGLLEVAKATVPSLTLQTLIELLREANVFFWPLARVSRYQMCRERDGEVPGITQQGSLQEGVSLVTKNKKKKEKTLEVKMPGSPRISLVGIQTPTVLCLKNDQIRKRVCDLMSSNTEPEVKMKKQSLPVKPGDISIRKESAKLIPIADIHAKIPQCQSKYTYYGNHDQILDSEDAEKEEDPLLYDDTGSLIMSERQSNIFNRIVNTVGTSQNNWQYCCQIFFTKFYNFVPTGSVKYEKDVLELYLKLQYFCKLKKNFLTNSYSNEELNKIRILLKYFWGNSTVICNHFSQRSHESVCKEMEKLQKMPQIFNCFLVSLRIIPTNLVKIEEKLLEHLQDEICALVAGDKTTVYLLPCSHSSIVCPHRSFPRVEEVSYHCNFNESILENEKLVSFLISVSESRLPGPQTRQYCGESLGSLVRNRKENVFRLPRKTLFKLNGMKRLRDAGFKMDTTDGLSV